MAENRAHDPAGCKAGQVSGNSHRCGENSYVIHDWRSFWLTGKLQGAAAGKPEAILASGFVGVEFLIAAALLVAAVLALATEVL